MKKLVNGRLVDMTPAEIAERQKEAAEFAKPRQAPPTLEQRVADLEAAVEALRRGRGGADDVTEPR